jgi:hypothetical protein
VKTLQKIILGFALVLACIFMPQAKAQSYSPQTLSGLPATLATSASANILSSVYVGNREYLSAVFKYLPGGTTTQNITITIDYSVDGSNWTVAPTTAWVFASPGSTNETTIGTNLNVGGWGWIRFKTIANAGSGSTITPSSLVIGDKILTRR